jgi:hypothetical protein
MIIFLFVLYIINGLIVAIWGYKDSLKIPMRYLERTGKLTLLRKIWLIISLIGVILLVTIIWPAWAVITICERNMN